MKKRSGFTIIELVLIIAIVGLFRGDIEDARLPCDAGQRHASLIVRPTH